MRKDDPPPYSEAVKPSHPPGFKLPDTSAYPIHANVTVTQAPIPVIGVINLGPESQHITCPSCHYQVKTTVESRPTTKTHLFALLCCIVGCWPFCIIPYCMDTCMSQRHTCPNCRSYIGEYQN